MRSHILAAVGAALAVGACVPGGPIYMGPPVVMLEGDVYSFERRAPIPRAEVCVFAVDTLCVATNERGHYTAHIEERNLLAGGRATLRFRVPGLRTAVVELSGLQPGRKTTVNCAISSRIRLAGGPARCMPIPEKP